MNSDFSIRKLLLFFSIALFSCSSVGSKQTSLIGEWQPVKVLIYNAYTKTTSIYYDRNNQKSTKETLYKQYALEFKGDTDDTEIDTTDFKNTLNENFEKFNSSKIVFKEDSTVIINSNGLIIPKAVPGWDFGDKVGGKWTQNTNKLKLEIGDDKINYPFFYKIVKLTNDSLILGMTMEDYGDVYMTLDFIRQ